MSFTIFVYFRGAFLLNSQKSYDAFEANSEVQVYFTYASYSEAVHRLSESSLNFYRCSVKGYY